MLFLWLFRGKIYRSQLKFSVLTHIFYSIFCFTEKKMCPMPWNRSSGCVLYWRMRSRSGQFILQHLYLISSSFDYYSPINPFSAKRCLLYILQKEHVHKESDHKRWLFLIVSVLIALWKIFLGWGCNFYPSP